MEVLQGTKSNDFNRRCRMKSLASSPVGVTCLTDGSTLAILKYFDCIDRYSQGTEYLRNHAGLSGEEGTLVSTRIAQIGRDWRNSAVSPNGWP